MRLPARFVALVAAIACAFGAAEAAATRRAVEVAQGVYALMADPRATAQGDALSANAGFIVGPRGVVVIDSGTSHRDGLRIIAAVGRVTPRPIRLVVLSHPGQAAVFGAAAFQSRGIPVLMHRRAASLMAGRCHACLENLKGALGEEAMAGTRVAVPDRLVDGDEAIDVIGRRLRLIAPAGSSAPGALAVLDERTATLFTGSIVSVRSVPDTRDADARGWPDALSSMASTRCRRLVPAHGAVGRCTDIAPFARYLADLEERVARLVRDGVGLVDLARHCELPAYASWEGYDARHAPNASRAYLRLERALFDEAPSSPAAKASGAPMGGGAAMP